MVALTPEEGNHSAQYTYDYRYLLDTYSKVDAAPVTVLRDAQTGKLVKTLETADIATLKKHGWVAPEVFVAKGRDGKTDMWGIIQRPTNFDPNKKYPVIEYIYSGPGDAYTPKSFMPYNWYTTSLAELGFIVVQLDAMGTSYRGKKFEEVCYKNLKDAGFPDRELGSRLQPRSILIWMLIMWQSMAVRQADRRVPQPYCCMAIFTRQPIVPAAVMTIGWIKCGGTSNG